MLKEQIEYHGSTSIYVEIEAMESVTAHLKSLGIDPADVELLDMTTSPISYEQGWAEFESLRSDQFPS